MSFDVLNPWMFAGLAAAALPIVAHLFSRKKYDLVSWGAMQFLELAQETRRKVWLEDLWLLLLRMALVAWLVFALARPWISANWLGDIGPQPNRDVVLIIDGSYSMAWEATSVTPQQAAVRWCEKFLGELRHGDTVAVMEAREQVRPLIEPATHDFNRVREVLKALPPPSSSANFPDALSHAVKLLSRTSHLRREVVLLTDKQAQGWFPDDANLWLRLDDLAKQSSIKPKLWVIDVFDAADLPKQPTERLNFHVERLQPTRELTVPGFPVRFQTRVRFSGGTTSVTRHVHFEVDGQRLAERTVSVSLAPNGEANIEFEHRFDAVGSHLVRVTLDADDLPTDNASEAVVVVTEALPVLIVDGDPRAEPVQSETFFLRAALAAAGNDTPWVKPTILKWSDWNAKSLEQFAVVVLANVPQLTDAQLAALTEYVQRGGGLGIALGNRVDKDRYGAGLFRSETGLIGVTLAEIESEPAERREEGIGIANGSLESPWLQRFRAERGAAFTTARFSRWWKVDVAKVESVKRSDAPHSNVGNRPQPNRLAGGVSPPVVAESVEVPRTGGLTPPASQKMHAENAQVSDKDFNPFPGGERGPDKQIPGGEAELGSDEIERKPALVLARLQTGAPYLVSGQFGRGSILLLTAPLDADWSTLPAKPDYVAFVHELLFQLAARRGDRNVAVGQPLVSPLAANVEPTEFVFDSPDGEPREAQLGGDDTSRLLLLNDTSLPGVYVLRKKEPNGPASARSPLPQRGEAGVRGGSKPGNAAPVKQPAFGPGRELFVVNADRAESNLTPLTDEQIATLAADDRMQFAREPRDTRIADAENLPRHELWQLLFLAFLGLLVFEVLLTRRLVRGGHVAAEPR